MANRNSITAERVRERMNYNPETGELTWRTKPSRKVSVGARAGYCRPDGYIGVGIDGQRCLAHRLIWLWMTGKWPSRFADHRDLDRQNNRWNNLRDANYSQSGANRGINTNNTSGIKGVSWCKTRGLWQVGIKINRRRIGLGRFPSLREAQAVYAAAAKRYFGDFARTTN